MVCDEALPGQALEFRVLGRWHERLRGLLWSAPDARAVALPRCRSIHTHGMSYAIDVAFVGRDGRVLRALRGLAPGGLASCPGASCVLERPASGLPWVREGDRLWVRAVSLDVLT